MLITLNQIRTSRRHLKASQVTKADLIHSAYARCAKDRNFLVASGEDDQILTKTQAKG